MDQPRRFYNVIPLYQCLVLLTFSYLRGCSNIEVYRYHSQRCNPPSKCGVSIKRGLYLRSEWDVGMKPSQVFDEAFCSWFRPVFLRVWCDFCYLTAVSQSGQGLSCERSDWPPISRTGHCRSAGGQTDGWLTNVRSAWLRARETHRRVVVVLEGKMLDRTLLVVLLSGSLLTLCTDYRLPLAGLAGWLWCECFSGVTMHCVTAP